jgi:hypothetical protein
MFDKHAVGESNFLFNKFPQVVTRECFYRASSQLLYDAVTAGNALLNTSGSEDVECAMPRSMRFATPTASYEIQPLYIQRQPVGMTIVLDLVKKPLAQISQFLLANTAHAEQCALRAGTEARHVAQRRITK